MHVAHKVTHLSQCCGTGLNDDLETGIHEVELVVSDNYGNFDEFIDLGVKPRHFTVNPDQSITTPVCHPVSLSRVPCSEQAH
jgi:hypothetical protein